ncbi:NADH dehydrogenase [ubiquinone] 1 beta subcomplex subunit 2, mitochondrial-like [Pieris brassicae]|uniref:NADH dehydrogenase [ubiquinone] 1 beta subcomplex subunit 2, mitochondrial n=1 Tax=Pieris brassicae TaxID=7116 RepID=A0A9P0TTE4_PIEBR|nr:NADH dehydrogenase [ubiquinone] 1 beta subcomplex subunit 2, mitochondrial-like [Pieris brassicae]CAH4035707.1 unnamed protein product [Pieris brassicae]
MLSRTILKQAVLLRSVKNAATNLKQIRNGGHGTWTYRAPPPLASKRETLLAEGLGALCWWWILYHIATEPEHIYGEWPYIDPSTWTNEELGIPDDSAGPLKK